MKIVIIGVLLAIIGFFTYVFFNYFERVESTETQGYQGIARQNNLLAVQRLLDKMHTKNKILRHLTSTIIAHFKPYDSVVFTPKLGMVVSQRQATQLLDWVKRGGHLIMTSDIYLDADVNLDTIEINKKKETENNDPLLNAFGVHQYYTEEKGDDYQVKFAPWGNDKHPTWTVEFNNRYVLRTTKQPEKAIYSLQIGKGQTAHLLHYTLGKGAVTILSDLWFIHNKFINRQDHAPFFWALLHQHHQPQTVWFLNPIRESESLLRLIWLYFAPLVVTLLLLLGLWLWRLSYRFGSIQIETQTTRRSLLEHIEASAGFLWRNGCQKQLLQPLQSHVQAQHHHTALSKNAIIDPTEITSNQQLIDTVKRLKDLS